MTTARRKPTKAAAKAPARKAPPRQAAARRPPRDEGRQPAKAAPQSRAAATKATYGGQSVAPTRSC